MKVLVSENPDGSVSITTMSPKTDVTIDAHRAELITKGVNVVAQVEDTELPDNGGAAQEYSLDEDTLAITRVPCTDQRRCHRDCWVWDGTAVVEDAVKVKEEKKKKARILRNKMLDKTDKDEFRLTGPELSALKAWRKSLRDLGTSINTDPDNITWPTKP